MVANRRKKRSASPVDMASTSIRLPSDPNVPSADRRVGDAHAAQHREPVAHRGAGAAAARAGPEIDVDDVSDPDRPGHLVGCDRDRDLPQVATGGAADGGTRQQLAGGDVVLEAQVGGELLVGAEVRRGGAGVGEPDPAYDEVVGGQDMSRPEWVGRGPDRHRLVGGAEDGGSDDDGGGHDGQPDPQPRVAPARW